MTQKMILWLSHADETAKINELKISATCNNILKEVFKILPCVILTGKIISEEVVPSICD